jgi:hypothetical protein
MLQAHVCNWELSGTPSNLRVWPNKAVYPHLTQLLLTPAAVTTTTTSRSRGTAPAAQPATPAAAQHTLDWPLLAALLQSGQWTSAGSLHLLAGGSDALMPARYETQDRLLCQVTGRQRVLLLPPEQAFSGVYPYPVHHPYDRYSAVDWEEPELDHWPAAAQVGWRQGALLDAHCALQVCYKHRGRCLMRSLIASCAARLLQAQQAAAAGTHTCP